MAIVYLGGDVDLLLQVIEEEQVEVVRVLRLRTHNEWKPGTAPST